MKNSTREELQRYIQQKPELAYLQDSIACIIDTMVERIQQGGKILVCGNGGSAADSEHIVGELMKEFHCKRPLAKAECLQYEEKYGQEGLELARQLQGAIPAISLVSQSALLSAFANDAAWDMAYAQQVNGYATSEDILIAITTSGNAVNVNHAARVVKIKGAWVLAMTGQTGGTLKTLSDSLLNVPERDTYLVQEYHLSLYHLVCRLVEAEIFKEG